MQRYIFLDLDDTLFQTKRKCALGPHDPALVVRAYLPDGTANSFATAKQQWLWDWLEKGFKIIPVTARDAGAFGRVTLPFQEEVVLNHGAVILDKHQQVDQNWMALMSPQLSDYRQHLDVIWRALAAYAQVHSGFKLRLVNDFDIIWYGVIKHESGSEAPLKRMLDEIVKPFPPIEQGLLYWHLNGNNLAILPKIITKEAAVSYLIERYRQENSEILTFGAGDSYSDAAFITLCDYALIPRNTQLFSTLTGAKHS